MCFPRSPLSRRNFLGLGVCGLSLAGLRPTFAADKRAPAKSVLVVLEQGGLSQMDTWDPKPDAVSEHRSPFKPISTKVPGMRFTELLTETARVADKLAVVRSMWHPKAGASGHGEGTQYMLSGAHPSSAIHMPDLGAVARTRSARPRTSCRRTSWCPGTTNRRTSPAPGSCRSGRRRSRPAARTCRRPTGKSAALEPRAETPTERLAARQQLLSGLNARTSSGSASFGGMERFYDQAFDTLTSPKVAKAFDYQARTAGRARAVR